MGIPSGFSNFNQKAGYLTLSFAILRSVPSLITGEVNRFIQRSFDYARDTFFPTGRAHPRLFLETIQTPSTHTHIPSRTTRTLPHPHANRGIAQVTHRLATDQLTPVNPVPNLPPIINPQHNPIPPITPLPAFIPTLIPNPPSTLPPILKGISTIPAHPIAAGPIGASLASAATSLLAIKTALAALPPLLYALYTSEEKTLPNVNVRIPATSQKMKYEIGIGEKGDGALAITFQVKAGQPVKLLPGMQAEIVGDEIPAIFPERNSAGAVSGIEIIPGLPPLEIPGLRLFEWRRQEFHTECNITIEDPGNPLLKHGPVRTFIKLSEHEGFHLIHEDPTLPTYRAQPYKGYDDIIPTESSEYVNFNTLSVEPAPLNPGEKHRTERISLGFHDDPGHADSHYLQITRWLY